MKTYRGCRDSTGRAHVTIDDGGILTPLPHLVRHSPDGYEWNYAGSGPADLARSLLADVLGFPTHSGVYQRFKFTVVAQLPQMPRYHEQALLDSLAKKLRQEYGDPPAALKKAPPDAGVDAGEP